MSEWRTRPVRRVFRVVNGGTPTPDPANWDGDVQWATPTDLARINGGDLIQTARTLTVEGLRSGSTLVPPGSLILSTRAPIGYVGQATTRIAFNQGCRALVPTAPVDLRFFRYQFLALAEDLVARGQGTTFLELSSEALGAAPIYVPSLPLQRHVADYLDAETTRIDALIDHKRRMVGLLNERWRAAATHRIAVCAQEMGTIPLRRVTRCLDGRRIPLSAEARATRQGPYPYYGASAIVDWIDDYLFDEDLVLVGEDGAQLGDPTSAIARRVSGKVWVNNHAHVLRPLGVDADLLVFLLNIFDRVPFISGATREKLTQDDLGRIPVPAGPLEAQARVAAQLVAERARCDQLASMISRQIDLLLEHRLGLISAAVTGQLDLVEAA